MVQPTKRQRFDVALLACCISQSVIEMKNRLTKIIRRVLVSLRTDQRFSMSQKKKRPLMTQRTPNRFLLFVTPV